MYSGDPSDRSGSPAPVTDVHPSEPAVDADRSDRSVLADTVFRRIGQAIISGELREGQLLRDKDLAISLNVSRMPIREALLRLERIGLVEIEPSRYTRVTYITAEAIDMHRELAGYTAGMAARMALRRLTADQADHAVALAEHALSVVRDPAAASGARRDLFTYLSSLSGNSVHHNLMAEMELSLERNLSRAPLAGPPPTAFDIDASLLRDIRQAIIDRDADGLERAIRHQHGIF